MDLKGGRSCRGPAVVTRLVTTFLRSPVMATSASETNAYDILNVSQDVGEAELRKAYRTQSLKVHPDRVSRSCLSSSVHSSD